MKISHVQMLSLLFAKFLIPYSLVFIFFIQIRSEDGWNCVSCQTGTSLNGTQICGSCGEKVPGERGGGGEKFIVH